MEGPGTWSTSPSGSRDEVTGGESVSGSSLQLQHLQWRSALHVSAAVRTSGVVAVDEVLQDVVDVGQPVEPTSVEGHSVALVQDRAVEPLDHGIVVGRARRDPMVGDP